MSLSDSQSCSSTTSADNNEAHKSSRHNYSESQRQHYSESADNSALNYCVPTSSDNTNAGTNSFAIFSNKFANDGTFMEMFKRMQQMQQIAKGDPDDEDGRGENAADSSSSLTEARFQSNEKMPKGGVDTSTRYNHDHISSTTSTTTTSRASSNSPIHNSKTSSSLPKSSASVRKIQLKKKFYKHYLHSKDSFKKDFHFVSFC